ncbi:MAG TPA: ion transporter [Paracoccaceae bacterium]|nr:ion transporter [Paracoccaceae bacterium]
MPLADDARRRLERWLETPRVRGAIMGVILLNAAVLGLETSERARALADGWLAAVDAACLAFFVGEILLKALAQGRRFPTSGWNLFDVVVVGVALLPASGAFSVLRAARVLRLMRVVSVAPRLRRVVEGFIDAVPGMASVFLLMGIIFYIGAVMATQLFGEAFPEWFGSLGASAYSLFQIMTLESWSMGIVRPVMQVHPWAWAFFVPFIMVTTFAVVNLLVGLIVNSMQDAHHAEDVERTDAYRDEVLTRLQAIEARLEAREREAGE